MGILESIGSLTLIIGGGYLMLKHIDYKDRRDRENLTLVEYSDKCKAFVENNSAKGILKITWNEYQSGINKILNDPTERASAIKKKQQREENIRNYNENLIIESKEKRKFGYKYENAIFEIFDIYEYIPKRHLLLRIENHYNIDKLHAGKLLNLWQENWLICSSNAEKYSVGFILKNDYYKLTDSDMSWEKWLELNGKKKKKYEVKYDDFPF